MYIGIDIGGTAIKYALVSVEGLVSKGDKMATPKTHKALITALTSIIRKFIQKQEIAGIGISAPGVIQRDGFMVTAGALPDSYGKNLKTELETLFKLPVYVENDANVAAIAEKWIGGAQDKSNYLCLVLGTGVGGGIVINQQVFRGSHGLAGEFGFMLIDQLPEKENLEVASLNLKASVIGGICEKYNYQTNQTIVYDALAIFAAAKTGDELAQKTLANFYQSLAVGIVNLISCFDPEIILIGGAISENPEFLAELTRICKKLISQHDALHAATKAIEIPIVAAKLKNNAGLIGAVYQVKGMIDEG